jgi:hypothetical protein
MKSTLQVRLNVSNFRGAIQTSGGFLEKIKNYFSTPAG